MHREAFAQSVEDERESSQVNLFELLQLCVHAGAISRQASCQPLPSRWRSDSTALLWETGHQTLRRAQDRRGSARGEKVAEDKA
jgi:hypothetical protein